MSRALVNVPQKARRGEVITIKTLISHVMETGYRHSTEGQAIPRDIITSFSCKYEGEEIFSTTFYPAIAANPFVTFHTVVDKSGTFAFTWEGDNGFSVTEEAKIVVS